MRELDFDLPTELIAQHPVANRSESRLLVLDRTNGALSHRQFADIGAFLRPGDLLVMNNTRVVPCRVHGYRAGTGGVVEILAVGTAETDHIRAMTGSKGQLKSGERILVGGAAAEGKEPEIAAELVHRGDDGLWLVKLVGKDGQDPVAAFRNLARMPLPPYIRRQRFNDPSDAQDRERYQTTYAAVDGAVAAPTAGLHFTPALLESLGSVGVGLAYLTLHVGIGTFAPVKAERLEDHQMHSEHYLLPAATASAVNRTRKSGGRVIAVGTTTTRVLESIAKETSGLLPEREVSGDTALMISPGHEWRVVNGLVTNFHLPRSTLLALVMSLAGVELVRSAYREAIANRYRFFSYGDAMLVT